MIFNFTRFLDCDACGKPMPSDDETICASCKQHLYGRRDSAVPTEIEEEETTPLPAQTMAELVSERKLPLPDLYHDDEIPCVPFPASGMY